MKRNKKAISIISITCAFVILLGGIFAFFSDNSILNQNTKVGKVDINVEGNLYHSNALNNLNPGDNDPDVPTDYRSGSDHELSFKIDNLGNKSIIYRTIIEVSASKNDNTSFTAEELMSIILSEKQNVTTATNQNNIASSDADKQTDISRLDATGYDDGKLVYIIGGTTDNNTTYVLNGIGDNAETETNVTATSTVQTFDIGLDKDLASETFQGATITFNVIVQAMQYRNTGDSEWNNIFEKTYTTEGTPETTNLEYKQNPSVFAVYSADDSSLTLFNRPNVPTEGTIYKTELDDGTLFEKTATNVYTGFDTTKPYLSIYCAPLWREHKDIKTVIISDKITPLSTAYWFDSMENIEYYDLRKLDTSNVIDTSNMFMLASSEGEPMDIIVLGLENFDMSNVTRMNQMFARAFLRDTNIDFSGVTNWDVSNVIYMSGVFLGIDPETPYELDLSGWDNSSAGIMHSFFGPCYTLSRLTLGPNFKLIGYHDLHEPLPDKIPEADGSRLWYIEGTNIGIAPEDVHKNATETITYVVYPTN